MTTDRPDSADQPAGPPDRGRRARRNTAAAAAFAARFGFGGHVLPEGEEFCPRGGCRHDFDHDTSREEFGTWPVIRSRCGQQAMGRRCPHCNYVY